MRCCLIADRGSDWLLEAAASYAAFARREEDADSVVPRRQRAKSLAGPSIWLRSTCLRR